MLLFIACNVAALLLNVYETRLSELLGPYVNYIVDASNALVVFNSSFNFVIYVTFSLPFRRTLKQYVCKRGKLVKKNTDNVCSNRSIMTTNINDDGKQHQEQQYYNDEILSKKAIISRLLRATQPEALI